MVWDMLSTHCFSCCTVWHKLKLTKSLITASRLLFPLTMSVFSVVPFSGVSLLISSAEKLLSTLPFSLLLFLPLPLLVAFLLLPFVLFLLFRISAVVVTLFSILSPSWSFCLRARSGCWPSLRSGGVLVRLLLVWLHGPWLPTFLVKILLTARARRIWAGDTRTLRAVASSFSVPVLVSF